MPLANENILERRVTADLSELRVDRNGGDGPVKIRGHAAVFNSMSEDLGGFREIVKRGAFRNSLNEGADVRALVDHDPSKILGRRSAGTLTVREDRTGLYVEIDPPDTQAGRDIMESMDRGDVTQMSFAFLTREDRWKTQDGGDVRELVEVDLRDVSIVTYPAYPETDVAVRSHEAYLQKSEEVTEEDGKTPTSVLRARLDLEEQGC